MKLSEVLISLYSDDIYRIIDTINSSTYSKDWNFNKKDAFLIHTGFVFEMQNEIKIELYYDFTHATLIRQKFMGDNPLVLGLICEFDVMYIKGYCLIAIKEIDENAIENIKFDECELTEESYNLEPFKLIEYETEYVMLIPERSKLISDLLILRGNQFYLDEDEIYP